MTQYTAVKKAFFPGCSIHQAVILHRVGGKEEHPHEAAPPPVGGINPLPPPPEHQRQQDCRKGEPEGQQEHQVHVVQGILIDKKDGPQMRVAATISGLAAFFNRASLMLCSTPDHSHHIW